MTNGRRRRYLAFFLTLSMFFIGGVSTAAAADSTAKPTFDLAISKVIAQCRGLLPSKKISCIKEKAEELVGDSVNECSAKPLGEKIPCLKDRLTEEAGKVQGTLWAFHLLYQGMHGRNVDNSVLGDMSQMARIRTNPLVLLEDKELLAGLKKDLRQELGEMKGADENGNCRKDASLIGLLNCFKNEYLPQVAVKETLAWMAYAKILTLYIADRNEVGKQLIDLHAELGQAAGDPQKLKDPGYRKRLAQSAQEVQRHAAANADFWRAHSKELLSSLDRIVVAGRTANAAIGKAGHNSDSLFEFTLPDGWNETFGPGGTFEKEFGSGSGWGTLGPDSDWDKIFGPNGSLTTAFAPGSDWDKTFGPGGTMDQANKELDQAGRDLKKLNESLDSWVRDMEKTRQSINASVKSIDRSMDRLQEDLAEMERIGHRNHEARNPLEGLDLSGIGDYVRGGPKAEEDKAKQAIVSLLLDFTPGVGDAKGIVEVLSGKDMVTGQKLSPTDRLLSGLILTRWIKGGKKAIKADELIDAVKKEKAKPRDPAARYPVGHRGKQEDTSIRSPDADDTSVNRGNREVKIVFPDGSKTKNSPTRIGGRSYTGHALDRMQGRGIMPSVVEDTIRNGETVPGKRANTSAHYNYTDGITVITDTKTGDVITVAGGIIKQ
ncbi:pre-toxin TG domain-containing protein [Streptomyces sp. NPDC052496]|uniref:pre-toxin TG domain-containing protein n=1 Tax=Streptomyces sp. NPDC052496 TaxID=3154951 RepID=UPI0034143045